MITKKEIQTLKDNLDKMHYGMSFRDGKGRL